MFGTLYLADLDGTLLTPDQTVSGRTRETLNALIEWGARISYATARSLETASAVTRGIAFREPVIVHNGAVLADPLAKESLSVARFSDAEKEEILSAFCACGLFPLTYSLIGGKNRFSYLWERCGEAQRAFIRTRTGGAAGSERAREIAAEERILDGDVFYFACLGEERALRPVYETLHTRYRCFYAPDIYLKAHWLEIVKRDVSKAAAALALKARLGAERLVCFGDAENDIPLFEAADECYAVENAVPALKERATGVIGSNREDSVAKKIAQLVSEEAAP